MQILPIKLNQVAKCLRRFDSMAFMCPTAGFDKTPFFLVWVLKATWEILGVYRCDIDLGAMAFRGHLRNRIGNLDTSRLPL